MNTRRGFFSALAGAVTGTAAGAVPVMAKSQRFVLANTAPMCNCGGHLFKELRSGVEVYRCAEPTCANYVKLFQRPTMELLQVGQVSARQLDRERHEWEREYNERARQRQEGPEWITEFQQAWKPGEIYPTAILPYLVP